METVVLSIAGALILILLSIIGYLIVEGRSSQKETNKEFFNFLDKQRESTEKLNISITALNGVLLSMQENVKGFERRYDDHKRVCDKRFESIGSV